MKEQECKKTYIRDEIEVIYDGKKCICIFRVGERLRETMPYTPALRQGLD